MPNSLITILKIFESFSIKFLSRLSFVSLNVADRNHGDISSHSTYISLALQTYLV